MILFEGYLSLVGELGEMRRALKKVKIQRYELHPRPKRINSLPFPLATAELIGYGGRLVD